MQRTHEVVNIIIKEIKPESSQAKLLGIMLSNSEIKNQDFIHKIINEHDSNITTYTLVPPLIRYQRKDKENEPISFRYLTIDSSIGSGAFAHVYLSSYSISIKDNIAIVKKKKERKQRAIKDFINFHFAKDAKYEADILSSLPDMHSKMAVICFHRAVVIMRYKLGIPLTDHLISRYNKPIPNAYDFTVEEQLTVARKLLLMLSNQCQQYGIIHRDIKPDNIKIQKHKKRSPSLRLVDFGLACRHDSNSTKRVGTPTYMAPESQQFPFTALYQSDLYSTGRVICHFFGLTIDFFKSHEDSGTFFKKFNQFDNHTFQFHFGSGAEKLTKDRRDEIQMTILKTQSCNPQDRPSITELLAVINEGLHELRHPPQAAASITSPPRV